MKLYLHISIILNFLFSNLIFSQEETTKFYITELRGDILTKDLYIFVFLMRMKIQ